jgi:hypothetical protein
VAMLAELALDGASDVEGSQQADQPAPCAGDPQHSSAAGCGAAECLAAVLRLRSCLAAMMLTEVADEAAETLAALQHGNSEVQELLRGKPRSVEWLPRVAASSSSLVKNGSHSPRWL